MILLVVYKALAAVLIFLASMLAIIYPLRKKLSTEGAEHVQLGEALASGIFLGAAFFHMLPEAIKIFATLYPHQSYPVPEVICICGFLLLLFLERFSLSRSSMRTIQAIPYILVITLVIHAFIEGVALGVGTLTEALMLFIAIIAHKGSESYALCMALLRQALPISRIIFLLVIFALMTPLGITFGTFVDVFLIGKAGLLVTATLNAFAAGSFLYISTLHHVHFHKHAREDRQGMVEFSFLVLGLLTMAVVAIWT